MAQSKKTNQPTRWEPPRGFRTNDLYYVDEETQCRLEFLQQHLQKGTLGKSARNPGTSEPQSKGGASVRTAKTEGAATKNADTVLCDAALVPPFPSSFLRNEKVAPYLSAFSTYGVHQPHSGCSAQNGGETSQNAASASAVVDSRPHPGVESSAGDSRLPILHQQHISQAPYSADSGEHETEEPPKGDRGNNLCGDLRRSLRTLTYEDELLTEISRTHSPSRQSSTNPHQDVGTGKTTVRKREHRSLNSRGHEHGPWPGLQEPQFYSLSKVTSLSSLNPDGSIGTAAAPSKAWPDEKPAVKLQRLSSLSSSIKSSEHTYTAGMTRELTQHFCLSRSAIGRATPGNESGSPLMQTSLQKQKEHPLNKASSPQKMVKGSDLVRGRCILGKQLTRTVERKWELLHDLDVKSKALKATNTKLLQNKVTEARLQQLEKTIDSKIAEVQKPLLSAAFSSSDSLTCGGGDPTGSLPCSDEQQDATNLARQPISDVSTYHGALWTNDSSESLLPTSVEHHPDLSRRSSRGSATGGRRRTGGVGGCSSAKGAHLKTKYVIVVDLASDMSPFLPDIRDELSKLVQQAMLKQHSLFNLIKLGNKVEAFMASMPRRVEESLLVALDKFIRGLCTAKKRAGTTDLAEGLRKALLMNPDIIYLISHTPPSNHMQQEECIQMLRDYYRAAERHTTDGRRWKRPPIFRYVAFRNPLEDEAYEEFFYNLCSESLSGTRTDAAQKNFFMADRASLWKSILKDTKQAKKLRTKLKKNSQLVTTFEALQKHVPVLREKLHSEVAIEKLLRLDFQKCEEAMEQPARPPQVTTSHGKRVQAAASQPRRMGANGKRTTSSSTRKRNTTAVNRVGRRKVAAAPGATRRTRA